MRRAMEMYSKACLWKTRTRSASPPGTGAGAEAEAGAGAAPELLLAAMRAREKRWQSHTKRSPRWKATKRSSAKPTNSGRPKSSPKDNWPISEAMDINLGIKLAGRGGARL
uniref:Uncharacterized protein n=2 Tax=Hominidae TaxID=9604 RepID=F1T0M2_HUMAN|nr:hypothetical protein HP11026 [Homo sapiens]